MNEIISRLKPIFDTQPYPVLILDTGYSILYSNRAASKIFGIKNNGSVHKCYKIIHNMDRPPRICYCGLGSSEIVASKIFEPSVKMTFRNICIPIRDKNAVLFSIILYKTIESCQIPSSTFDNCTEPLTLGEAEGIEPTGRDLFINLTEKEKEVLSWIKKGKPSSQISSIMKISPNTVNFHIKNIFNKLGAENRAQAVALAYEKELEQRDLALREINHRVMNNFHILNSMINLRSRKIKNRETTEILREISLHIQGFSSFHKAMIPAGDSPCVSAVLFIGKALDDFSRSFEEGARRIVIEHQIDDIQVKTGTAITCMQIISELISNSIKHSFQGKKDGKINVRLTRMDGASFDKGKNINVEVEDNGTGLPDSYDIVDGKSYGMNIVSALASQIGGDIKVHPGRNSCLSFNFRDESRCSS